MQRIITILSLVLIFSIASVAMTLQEAKKLYVKGEYSRALPEFERQYKKNPRNASINHWLGVCLFYEGNLSRAEKYLIYADKKEVQESSYYLAKLYHTQYRGAEAIEYAEKYESYFIESTKTMSTVKATEIELIKRSASMMDHVDNIEVIDSVVVEKESFFKYYRISQQCGKLADASMLPESFSHNTGVVYMPETETRMMWSQNNDEGVSHLVESTRLIDDSWDKPHVVGENLGEGGDVKYPFMMPDGSTLYFASNGNGSIGGLDIFMTRRDSETMEYYRPQNMGYPYNSPYDDYLLVIDEFTGAGWWATDRNQLDGKVTIYIFKPQEVRDNYSTDNPKLSSLAALRSIKDTWRDGADYSELLAAISAVGTEEKVETHDFEFELPTGEMYYSLDDFNSPEAKTLMTELLQLKSTIASKEQTLEGLRMRYASERTSATGRLIIQLENEVESLRRTIYETTNAIIKKEINI